jgi:hypothetical protein
MTRTNIAVVLIVIAALVAIGTAQTSTQGQQRHAGRYQLLSAQYKWLATDAERKLVVDDQISCLGSTPYGRNGRIGLSRRPE